MYPNIVVTTVRNANQEAVARAGWWANSLGCPYLTRGENELASLISGGEPDKVLVVVGRSETRLYLANGEFYFHPNMAKLRVQNLEKGQADTFATAAGLEPGATLLDCTLGLAADAIVASHIVGPAGQVVGLESQPLLAMLAEEGLSRYPGAKGSLAEAMARIRVVNTAAERYLPELPDGSFDVVYFDPMFRYTKLASSGMTLLRCLANPRPVTKAMIEEAVRVASKRVVLKERRGARIFEELGIGNIVGGKYSAVSYGIITKNG